MLTSDKAKTAFPEGSVKAGFFIFPAAGVFAADQFLKNHAEKTCAEGETKKIWNGRLLLRRHHNSGFALDTAKDRQKTVAAVSAGMSVGMAGMLVYCLYKSKNNLMRAGLSLIVGGAFSNTYDRLKRRYVVDYISFNVKWRPLRNLVFNMGDFAIMAGALFTALGSDR